MEPGPDAGLVPIAQAAPAGHPRAATQFLGQHLPGDATLQHEDDAGQGRAIRHAGSAALGLGRLGRQQRGDDRPQVVADKGFGHPPRLPCHSPVLIDALRSSERGNCSLIRLFRTHLKEIQPNTSACQGYFISKSHNTCSRWQPVPEICPSPWEWGLQQGRPMSSRTRSPPHPIQTTRRMRPPHAVMPHPSHDHRDHSEWRPAGVGP